MSYVYLFWDCSIEILLYSKIILIIDAVLKGTYKLVNRLLNYARFTENIELVGTQN